MKPCFGLGRAFAFEDHWGKGAEASAGQMTIELAVAFPVLLVVAAIAVNAMFFFGECAAFDRAAHQAVRVHATSPAYRQDIDGLCAAAVADIKAAIGQEDAEVVLQAEPCGLDYQKFTARLSLEPNLFGMKLRSPVFGVSLPNLVHETVYVVDVYKPGFFI